MPVKEMHAKEIKQRFKKKQRRFYLVNALMAVVIGLSLSLAMRQGVYREAFGFILLLFFIWIFNVDKLRLCPQCCCVPRDRRQGLLSVPRQCASCGVSLL